MFAEEASVQAIDGRELPLAVFLGKGDGGRSILGDLRSHPEYAEVGYLPVAYDLFNNRYVLDLQSGRLLYLHYVNGGVDVVPVAEDFASFLDQIEIIPED